MKRLVTLLLLCAWLGGCVAFQHGPDLKACPPGKRPGGLHPSEAAALRNHVRHGYQDMRKGDCQSARSHFQLALEIDPHDGDAKAGWQEADACCSQTKAQAETQSKTKDKGKRK